VCRRDRATPTGSITRAETVRDRQCGEGGASSDAVDLARFSAGCCTTRFDKAICGQGVDSRTANPRRAGWKAQAEAVKEKDRLLSRALQVICRGC